MKLSRNARRNINHGVKTQQNILMVIKCISIKPSLSQKELLPKAYLNSDFHITKDKEYLVLGISFMLDPSVGRFSMVEIVNDYNHLSGVPLFLFNPHCSKNTYFHQISNVF